MRRLGAIIAGGKSTRFGGDKSAALLDGLALVEHVGAGLRSQVDELVMCGRDWPGIRSIADRPSADMGPLGGLNAALRYAADNDFDYVITAGCDVLPVPEMPVAIDGEKAVFLENHFLFGIWPAALAGILDKHMEHETDRSMRHWLRTIDARSFHSRATHYNLNTPADLAQYETLLKAKAA